MNNQTNPYDIASTTSPLNAYNRYPFTDITDAIYHAKQKKLQPGEIAICYYFDEKSIVGINAVIAVGNLRKGGNIIFENIKMDEFRHEVMHNIMENQKAIKDNIDVVNVNNRICAEVKADVKRLEKKVDMNAAPANLWVDLDKYDLDL